MGMETELVEVTDSSPATAGGNQPVPTKEKPYVLSHKTLNYILGGLEAVLLLRFIFKLSGANPNAGIINMLYTFTDLFMAPFRLIFPNVSSGVSTFEWSVLVAMLIYALIVYAVIGLLDIARTVDTNKT
jgi:hypothetical protein